MSSKQEMRAQLAEELQQLRRAPADSALKETAVHWLERLLDSADRNWQATFDAVSQAVCMLDCDGMVVQCNRAMAEMLGAPSATLIGQEYCKLVFGDETPPSDCPFVRMLGSHESESSTLTARGRVLAATATPVKGESDKLTGAICTLTDMTEQVRSEEALREKEGLLRAALESTADGILVVDRDGRASHHNERFAEMWRIPADVLGTKDDSKLLDFVLDQLLDPDAFLSKVQKLYRSDEEDFDTLLFKDGRVFERFSSPLIQKAEIAGRVWNFRDVTERVQSERVQDVLSRISHASNTSTDLNDLLQTIHHQLGRLIDTTNFFVALYSESSGCYSFPYCVDAHDELDDFTPQELKKSLTDYVRRTGTPLLADAAVHQKLSSEGEVDLVGAWSPIWLGVPLQTPRGTIGVVVVQSYTDDSLYKEKDVELMSLVSVYIAAAIERKRAEEALQESYNKLERTMKSTVYAMAKTSETRDPYTAGHQRRVALLSKAIARRMGLPEDQVNAVHMAAMVHDIGKINVPAEILSKPGHLTEVEIDLIRIHPKVSYEILEDIEFPWPIAEMVLQHHERLDGSGYPGGISGDDILLEARILGVADVVEAISSHRPYRSALGTSKAIEEIESGAGKVYDPRVVEACVAVLTEQDSELEW
jgi:PAS domain S-box-containing protein